MKIWWVAAGALLIVGLGAAAFALIGPGLAAGQGTQYLTAKAATADVTDEIVATGTLQSARTYALSFGTEASVSSATPSSGSDATGSTDQTGSSDASTASRTWDVTAVEVAVGDHVQKGDTLATADTDDIDDDIAIAKARVDAAEAAVGSAADDALAATAESQLLDAQRTLNDLQAARKHATLQAPAAGTVAAVNIDAGSRAPSGTAITISSDAMVASATVTESDVASVAMGQDASVSISALDQDVTGSVSYIAPSGSSTSGVVGFGVLIALDDVPDGTRPGMSGEVTVVAAEAADVLAVPSSAVDGSAGAYTVTVLTADGSTATRQVEVGLVTDDLVEITNGLSVGETVVTGTVSDQQTTTNGGFGGGLGGPPGGGAFPGGGGPFPGGGGN